MYERFGLFIDGAWRGTGGQGTIAVVDPANEERLGAAPSASVADVEEAIASAAKGLKTWRSTAAWTRAETLHACARVMEQRAEEVARRMTLESGKPLAQARR